MKFHLKNFTLRHYLRYVRRQNKHIQHIHGFAFAGIITALIASFILYTDYGFWHETYRRQEAPVVTAEPVPLGKSFGNFLQEAKTKFDAIGNASADLVGGTETYTKTATGTDK